MTHIKTRQNDSSVAAFLDKFKSEDRYPDFQIILDLMKSVSGEAPKIWGKDIVGFGSYQYKGKSTEGEWFYLGFSPRKQNISLYIISGFEKEAKLLSTLGKYKTGRGCMYIKRLEDIDLKIFEEFLKRSMKVMKEW